MVARVEDPHVLVVGEGRRDRVDAAAQGLPDDEHVRAHVLPLAGEEPAGAAETRLDLVGDEGDPALPADLGRPGQIAVRGNHHAALALDRLHHEADGVLGDGRLEGVHVAVGHELEARGEGPEALPVLVLRGEADDRRRPAVEVPFADDDLGPVRGHALRPIAPLPDRLDGGLHRLGARVHRERLVVAGGRGQLGQEGAHLVVVEGPGRQGQTLHLLPGGPEDLRVAVPLVQRRIGAEHVQVLVALHVPDPHPLAPVQHHGQGLVVVGADALGLLNQFVGPGRAGLCHEPSAGPILDRIRTSGDDANLVPPDTRAAGAALQPSSSSPYATGGRGSSTTRKRKTSGRA